MPHSRQSSPEGESHATSLGARVRRIRKRREWSLDELAERAGMSKSFLWEIENDRSDASGERLLKLADALGTTVEYLLRGTDGEGEEQARIVEIPSALSEAAEEAGLSHRSTLEVLSAHRAIMGRRNRQGMVEPTKDDWKKLIAALHQILNER